MGAAVPGDRAVSGKGHPLRVDKVVAGGLGLGRLPGGLVAMVPQVLPGEMVRVAVRKEQRGFAEATLLAVLEASPQRVSPPCPHFGRCGGCQLQHGAYGAQLAIKEAILRETLERGGLTAGEIDAAWRPILPSPEPWQYRQRLRLQVADDGRLGFFASRSHQVIDTTSCPLAVPLLNQVWAELPAAPAFRAVLANTQAVELLHSPLDEGVVLLLHLRRRPRAADLRAAAALTGQVGKLGAVWLAGKDFAMSGPHGVHDQGAGDIGFALSLGAGQGLTLRFAAGGFCQVNLAQNQALVAQLLDWAGVGATDSVLDLFSGMGNFSLPLARAARRVVGSDLQRSSIRGAQANAVRNGLGNCHFLRADARQAVEELLRAGEGFDCLLLDPPRAGCREIVPLLPKLGAGRLIYISCDPATLVRDLGGLAQCGFRLDKIRAVDMFPQTSHVESIALLRRTV